MKIFFRLAAQAVLTGSAASFLVCAPSQAVVVSVGGVPYGVTVLETSYTTSASTFQQPPQGQMPWWGNQAMATEFAVTVFDLLGEGSTGGWGPYFAYRYLEIFGIPVVDVTMPNVDFPGVTFGDTALAITTAKYAIAAQVPGPLPLFGAAAIFGWSRQLRRRIRP